MAPPVQTTREAWIKAGLQALAAGGPDNVRVDRVARDLAVSRGGFHGHFSNRGAYLDALLEAWEQTSVDDVVAEVEQEDEEPRAKIRRAGQLTFSRSNLGVDLAVRDWARHDQAVARRLHRVDASRLAYLRQLFGTLCADPDEVEARAVLAFTLAVGSQFIRGYLPGQRATALRLATDFLVQ